MERKCGPLELFSVYRNVLDMSTTVFVSGEYSTSVSKSWLYPALAKVIKNHWCLTTNVYDSETKYPKLVQVSKIDLNNAVEFREDIESFEELTDIVFGPGYKFKYECDQTIWKLFILGKEQNKFAFVFDHAICDGTSGSIFHQDLIAALNSVDEEGDNGQPENIIINDLPTECNRIVESFGQTTPSWSFFAKTVFHGIKESIVGIDSSVYLGPEPCVPPRSKSIILDIDPEKASKIIKAAKSKGITVQSFLYAALMQSIADTMDSKEKEKVLSFATPVNARRFTKNHNEIGNYVYQHAHKLDKNWSNEESTGVFNDKWATDFDQHLKNSTKEAKDIAYIIGLLDYVDIRDYYKQELEKKKRGETAEISNLGRVSAGDDTSKIKLVKISLAQPVTSRGAHVILSAASTNNGYMSLCISCALDDDEKTKCYKIKRGLFNVLQQFF